MQVQLEQMVLMDRTELTEQMAKTELMEQMDRTELMEQMVLIVGM